jgi:2-keto-4-pentenoate hydratase
VQFGADSQVFVEAEVCVRFGRALRDASSLDQLRGSIAEYRPCLELLDYARPRGDLRELFEHAFFHAGIVLGRVVTAEQVAVLSAGLPRAVGADGQAHGRLDFAVPSDVMLAVQRAVELILSAGGSVRSGQLLLCGSYIEPVALPHGASVRAEYGFAQVEVRRPA